jgi:colanic acid biosynthesis glycosyl transferase WcaI
MRWPAGCLRLGPRCPADRFRVDRCRETAGYWWTVHVLVLNEYFPPDTSATAKNADLAVAALAKKHQVTVLAGRPSYDPTARHPLYLLRREARGSLTVERVGSTAFPRFRMPRRVCNYLSYLALAIPRALAIESDVVLAMTDPPIEGIAGALVSRLSGRPFVYNIRDMYPDMAVGGGIVRSSGWRGSLIDRWEAMHRRALQHATRVIVLGEDMRERIVAKGVDPARIAVVRDAVPFPETLPAIDHPIVREIRGEFRFVLVHAGNLGFYGAWQTLLDCARMLESEGVGLVFVGEGAKKAEVEKAAQGQMNVRFMPFRPTAEVPYVMAAGDLHVVTVRRGLEGVVVPSKVYGILAAGRPLLAMATDKTEVARFAGRDGCGLAADPDDPASAAESVRKVMNAPGTLAEMGRRARELARGYDRVDELDKFVRAVEEAARR